MSEAVRSKREVFNPPIKFERTHIQWDEDEGAPPVDLQVFKERAKSIVAKNDSPDIGFTYSVNPYRGCFHACAYCYARPSHQYLGFGAGTDFENRIVAKINAAELLQKHFEKSSWHGDEIVFSGNTAIRA